MKVAVIGAGFSGMLSAYLLEKEGLDVTIYEKEEYIGGHCRSIISKEIYTELGTVFSFASNIKELLIELQVDYKEHFIYKNYVDKNFNSVEVISREEVSLLVRDLKRLEVILANYSDSLSGVNFEYVHEDLMLSFSEFTKQHDLKYVCDIVEPFLSSFGIGSTENTQAYYVFKIFDIETLYSFIKGEKLLSFNKGTSELISKLSQNISDIRYSLEVKNIELVGDKVKVESLYGIDYYDKVLITTKLPSDVIKDKYYKQLMQKIETTPFLTCVYEIVNSNIETTYFKDNLGKQSKIQFFFASKHMGRTTIVAYAYGIIEKEIIDGITNDIENLGINIKQLVTVKQWDIFPHLSVGNLTSNFYKDINDRQRTSKIGLIGSLICEPSIDSLYVSVKNSIQDVIKGSLI